MNNITFISLNMLYFLFGVVLINTIQKEFFAQTDEKIRAINSNNIFIPKDREQLNTYLEKLCKENIIPNYIFILPQSDILVSKKSLWDLVRSRHYNNITYLYNFFLRSYILDNYLDRQLLEERIYKKHKKYPIQFILSNSKNKMTLFTLKTHYDFFDLLICYNEGKYNIIQEIGDNIFKYENNILMLEVYVLVTKKEGEIKVYMYNYEKYQTFDITNMKFEKAEGMLSLLLQPSLKKQYRKIIRQLKFKLKFLIDLIKDLFLQKNRLDNSVMFELFSVMFLLDSNFNIYFFQLSRKINMLDKKELKLYAEMMFQTYNLVRGDTNLENSKFLQVS